MNQLLNSYNILWRVYYSKHNVSSIYRYIPIKSSLLLLSDGSLTRILDSILNNTINIKLTRPQKAYLFMKNFNYSSNIAGLEIYRQGWLQNKSDRKLVFASSWYNSEILSSYQSINTIPLGKMFISSELIIHRRLYHISCVCSKWFEEQFEIRGYIWNREYILYHKEYPLILIREFFSPTLTKHFSYR